MDNEEQTKNQDSRTVEELLRSIELLLLELLTLEQSRPIVLPPHSFVITCDGRPFDPKLEAQLTRATWAQETKTDRWGK